MKSIQHQQREKLLRDGKDLLSEIDAVTRQVSSLSLALKVERLLESAAMNIRPSWDEADELEVRARGWNINVWIRSLKYFWTGSQYVPRRCNCPVHYHDFLDDVYHVGNFISPWNEVSVVPNNPNNRDVIDNPVDGISLGYFYEARTSPYEHE